MRTARPWLIARFVRLRTYRSKHMRRPSFLSSAECSFEGDQFDELNALLSDRLRVLDYAAVLNVKVRSKSLVEIALVVNGPTALLPAGR